MTTNFATAEGAVFVQQAAEVRRAYATWKDEPIAAQADPAPPLTTTETRPLSLSARDPRNDSASLDPRQLGRELAAQTPTAEVSRLMTEHRKLARKKVTEGLTASETRALQLIRWNLDRIEDAQLGHGLDELERSAAAHESLAFEVAGFVKELRQLGRR